MNIDKAARATHMHCVHAFNVDESPRYIVRKVIGGSIIPPFLSTVVEAQAACDRLNLLSVLEAIREPSVEMYMAGVDASLGSLPDKTFRAMIDALIADVQAQK